MAEAIEKLFVEVEARNDRLRAGMKQAERIVDESVSTMARKTTMNPYNVLGKERFVDVDREREGAMMRIKRLTEEVARTSDNSWTSVTKNIQSAERAADSFGSKLQSRVIAKIIGIGAIAKTIINAARAFADFGAAVRASVTATDRTEAESKFGRSLAGMVPVIGDITLGLYDYSAAANEAVNKTKALVDEQSKIRKSDMAEVLREQTIAFGGTELDRRIAKNIADLQRLEEERKKALMEGPAGKALFDLPFDTTEANRSTFESLAKQEAEEINRLFAERLKLMQGQQESERRTLRIQSDQETAKDNQLQIERQSQEAKQAAEKAEREQKQLHEDRLRRYRDEISLNEELAESRARMQQVEADAAKMLRFAKIDADIANAKTDAEREQLELKRELLEIEQETIDLKKRGFSADEANAIADQRRRAAKAPALKSEPTGSLVKSFSTALGSFSLGLAQKGTIDAPKEQTQRKVEKNTERTVTVLGEILERISTSGMGFA